MRKGMALALSHIKPSCFYSFSAFSRDISSPSSSFNHRPIVILPVKSKLIYISLIPWLSDHFFMFTLSHIVLVINIIPHGLGNNSGDYYKLQLTLKEYGIATVVAKVSRVDWLRNAAGLVDPNYWRGTLSPRPVLDWYLKRVDEAAQEAKMLTQGGSLSLVGHSAGGWLARVCMEELGLSHISLLLTLGTPHLPPPKGSTGVIDQTRGLLNYVEKHCSKAVYTPQLRYVCIAGRYIQGARLLGNSSDANTDGKVSMESAGTVEVALPAPTATTPGLRSRFIGQGYKQVCGRADVWGDGVVPEESAHLEGALNISLDGVYHSPVASDDSSRPWYGSPAIVEQWIHHLLT